MDSTIFYKSCDAWYRLKATDEFYIAPTVKHRYLIDML